MIDLRLGNVLDVLAQMPSESVHCIVTSPPYWGLRAYGTEPQVWRNGSEPCDVHQWGESTLIASQTQTDFAKSGLKRDGRPEANRVATNEKSSTRRTNPATETNTCTRCGAWRGELGLEPTPELFVEHIVAVMREARRVLRADGTLWLNIGDSYAGSAQGWGHDKQYAGDKQRTNRGSLNQPLTEAKIGFQRPANYISSRQPNGLKPKDLVGIPWRVAFALQADGWYLRMDCIWHKPNPMPESVRDRPTKAHEYLFLLAKQPRYYYDAEVVRESGGGGGRFNRHSKINKDRNDNGREDKTPAVYRNRRSVWTVTTHPYSGAHFATFPPKLIEPCILAATSERGVCSKCGAPWVRVVEKHLTGEILVDGSIKQTKMSRRANAGGSEIKSATSVFKTGMWNESQTTGWRASCACDAGEPVPATVLDLFNGAGTTGLVALQHGRNYIGIDIKAEYLQMTRERLDKAQIALAVA